MIIKTLGVTKEHGGREKGRNKKFSLCPILTPNPLIAGIPSTEEKNGLDTVPERTAHSTDAVTNSVFIQCRNINSTLGENVYTVFDHSIFCCT